MNLLKLGLLPTSILDKINNEVGLFEILLNSKFLKYSFSTYILL